MENYYCFSEAPCSSGSGSSSSGVRQWKIITESVKHHLVVVVVYGNGKLSLHQ